MICSRDKKITRVMKLGNSISAVVFALATGTTEMYIRRHQHIRVVSPHPAPPTSRIKRIHLTHKEKNVFKSEESTEK